MPSAFNEHLYGKLWNIKMLFCWRICTVMLFPHQSYQILKDVKKKKLMYIFSVTFPCNCYIGNIIYNEEIMLIFICMLCYLSPLPYMQKWPKWNSKYAENNKY